MNINFHFLLHSTEISEATSADPDQLPHFVASDLGLQYLHN